MYGKPVKYRLSLSDEEQELITANIEYFSKKRGWKDFYRSYRAGDYIRELLDIYNEILEHSLPELSITQIYSVIDVLTDGGYEKDDSKKLSLELTELIKA